MKGFPASVKAISATDLKSALASLAKPRVKLLAGGTDLMVVYESGGLSYDQTYLNISYIKELRGIKETPDTITIGALTTFAHIQKNVTLCEEFPNLVQAAALVGGPAIQSRGTIGGNIMNASPAGDSMPALMAYDAELVFMSEARGERRVKISNFYLGYKKLASQPDEMLVAVALPRVNTESQRVHYFRKVGTRNAQAISKVVFAVTATLNGREVLDFRLGLGSVAPMTIRAHSVEHFLVKKQLSHTVISDAVRELHKDIAPIDDIRSTHEYRRVVSANLLREFLLAL
jgi:CO/xanthine dehydrogenase FAD-binding subunit